MERLGNEVLEVEARAQQKAEGRVDLTGEFVEGQGRGRGARPARWSSPRSASQGGGLEGAAVDVNRVHVGRVAARRIAATQDEERGRRVGNKADRTRSGCRRLPRPEGKHVIAERARYRLSRRAGDDERR